MPTNITSPNTVEFVFEPTDINGNPTFPTFATITINYFSGATSQSTTSSMVAVSNGRWTKFWPTIGVDVPSDVDWAVVTSLSTPFPALTGEIRIIDP